MVKLYLMISAVGVDREGILQRTQFCRTFEIFVPVPGTPTVRELLKTADLFLCLIFSFRGPHDACRGPFAVHEFAKDLILIIVHLHLRHHRYL